jgi:UDP-glucose 4-epimerase
MATYLVTGGAGFIGSHVVETLLQRGEQVCVLDNFATGKLENLQPLPAVELRAGDIRDMETVRAMVGRVDYVIHLAAMVSVSKSMLEPDECHAVNVNGTLNILNAAREFKTKRVVLASSCAVYGDNEQLPLSETSTVNPLSPYAATKLIGEVYCQNYYRAFGVPTACLRFFNVYGPRQDPNGDYAAVIPKFAQRLKQGRAPIVYGDGLQTRDFVHVSDIVRAVLLACEHPQAVGRVFNVATGREVSILDLVEEFSALIGSNPTPDFQSPRAGDIRRSTGSGILAAELLGFQPQVALRAGLHTIL